MVSAFVPVLVSALILLPGLDGHGRLIDPPNRATMWRFGFDNPVDVQDNELSCGGQKHQWEEQNGRCGTCGDPYDMFPRPHEAGGLYANGVIVDTYVEAQRVGITLELTAPHKGWFQFRLCPVNNKKVKATQSCLDRHLLKFTDGQTKYYLPKNFKAKNLTVDVVLPDRLTCSQCVLQWKYHTGKDWGCDKPDNPDSCCVGCGPQEEFYGCSDVAIFKRGSVIPKTTKRTTKRPSYTVRPTTSRPRRTYRPTTRRPIYTVRPTTSRPRRTYRPTTRRPTYTVRPTTSRPRRTYRPTTRRPTYTVRPTTSRPRRTYRPTTRRPMSARPTTTRRPTTARRTFVWQRTTRPTSNAISWWNRTTTRSPYFTKRPTTRTTQAGKVPTWKWKSPTTKKHWWQTG